MFKNDELRIGVCDCISNFDSQLSENLINCAGQPLQIKLLKINGDHRQCLFQNGCHFFIDSHHIKTPDSLPGYLTSVRRYDRLVRHLSPDDADFPGHVLILYEVGLVPNRPGSIEWTQQAQSPNISRVCKAIRELLQILGNEKEQSQWLNDFSYTPPPNVPVVP